MLKQKNSKKQGDVGLGAAIAYFTNNGYTVCVPLTDSQAYDLLVDDGLIKRVQVKTTTQKKGSASSFVVELRTTGGNQSFNYAKKFDPSLADLVFVVSGDGKQYLIPTDKIKARSMMCVGETTKEFQVFNGLVI